MNDVKPRCDHFYGTHTDRQCVLPGTFQIGEYRYCRQHFEAHSEFTTPPAEPDSGVQEELKWLRAIHGGTLKEVLEEYGVVLGKPNAPADHVKRVLRNAISRLEVIETADVCDMESRNHNAGPMKARAVEALNLLRLLSEHRSNSPATSVAASPDSAPIMVERLIEIKRAAHEWAAGYPLQGHHSNADHNASMDVYSLCEAFNKDFPSPAPSAPSSTELEEMAMFLDDLPFRHNSDCNHHALEDDSVPCSCGARENAWQVKKIVTALTKASSLKPKTLEETERDLG